MFTTVGWIRGMEDLFHQFFHDPGSYRLEILGHGPFSRSESMLIDAVHFGDDVWVAAGRVKGSKEV